MGKEGNGKEAKADIIDRATEHQKAIRKAESSGGAEGNSQAEGSNEPEGDGEADL